MPKSLFIILLGIIGILISLKYSERADRHAVISRSYRRAASDLVGTISNATIEQIHQDAASRHDRTRNITNIMAPIRARVFWILINTCIVALGVLVLFV